MIPVLPRFRDLLKRWWWVMSGQAAEEFQRDVTTLLNRTAELLALDDARHAGSAPVVHHVPPLPCAKTCSRFIQSRPHAPSHCCLLLEGHPGGCLFECSEVRA